MDRLLNWLNSNAGAFSVLFAAVVAAATVFYAVLTKALVAETRRMREAQTEPQITIRAESSEVGINLIDLLIENIGGGPAFDLRLAAIPDFEGHKGYPLSQFGPFKHGVRVFGPGEKITKPLANVTGRTAELETPDSPFHFSVRAQYRSTLGREYDQRFLIDFRHLVGSVRVGTPPLRAMAESLEKMQKEFGELVSGFRRLKVVAYTPDDIKREEDEDWAEIEARRAPGDSDSGDSTS
jgi:HAMP domain-containing protein